MARRKKKRNKKPTLITIGTLIILLSMIFVSYITYIQMNPNVDKNVIKDDDNEEKMEVTPGGGSASLEYSNQVSIDKKEQKINLYLKNKNKSRENISIEIYVEDKIVGESKIIPTGYLIQELELKDIDIGEGNYKGYIKVYFYDEDSNEKAIVDSKIKVDINVK